MGIGLRKILQVKIPVADLQRSVSWYIALLELDLGAEFVEDGVLRGAALVDRDGEYVIALRDREVCASRPNLTGFDVVGLAMSSERDLERLIERCDRLGVEHGQVQGRGAGRTAFDVADPDGTVLRFIYAEEAVPDRFIGMDSRPDGQVAFYQTPKLAVE